MSVILGIKIENKSPLGEMRKELNRIRKEVMKDVGEEFVRYHVKPHFGPSNRARFKHEKRNDVYEKEIKKKKGQGDGKHVDNKLTGRSMRQTLATAKVTSTRDKATVRATVPGYFKKPFVGTFTKTVTDKSGRTRQVQKRVTRQPDKVKELGEMDRKDVDALTKFALRRGRMYWRQAKATRRKQV
jgi:hypothetical protein